MDIANYTTAVNRAGEIGHYPLSTETLSFIQEQIKMIESLVGIVGDDMIIKSPTMTSAGIAIVKGELVRVAPIASVADTKTALILEVEQTSQDVTTAEDVYKGARTIRTAKAVKQEGGYLKINDRGELEGIVESLPNISDIYIFLFKLYSMSTASVSSGDFPLFGGMDRELPPASPCGTCIIRDPRRQPGYVAGSWPFYDSDGVHELKDAVLRTKVVASGKARSLKMDLDNAGLMQEITTTDGVVYERYLTPANVYNENRLFDRDIPWHAKPGSVIGTLVALPGGDWIRTGIFRYGRLQGISGDWTLINGAHKLLNRRSCCLQVSASQDNVAVSRSADVSWTFNGDNAPGIRFRMSGSQSDINTTYLSIIAFALPDQKAIKPPHLGI